MAAGQLQEQVTPGGGGSEGFDSPGVEPCPPRASWEPALGWGKGWSPVHGHPGQLSNAGQHPSHFHLVPDEGQPHGYLMGDVAVGRVRELGVGYMPMTLPHPDPPSQLGHRGRELHTPSSGSHFAVETALESRPRVDPQKCRPLVQTVQAPLLGELGASRFALSPQPGWESRETFWAVGLGSWGL